MENIANVYTVNIKCLRNQLIGLWIITYYITTYMEETATKTGACEPSTTLEKNK